MRRPLGRSRLLSAKWQVWGTSIGQGKGQQVVVGCAMLWGARAVSATQEVWEQ